MDGPLELRLYSVDGAGERCAQPESDNNDQDGHQAHTKYLHCNYLETRIAGSRVAGARQSISFTTVDQRNATNITTTNPPNQSIMPDREYNGWFNHPNISVSNPF